MDRIVFTWISSSEDDSDSLELSESLRPPKNLDIVVTSTSKSVRYAQVRNINMNKLNLEMQWNVLSHLEITKKYSQPV